MITDDRDALLLNWRFDPYRLAPVNALHGNGFGCAPVWDPISSVWRLFYGYGCGAAGATIHQVTSPNGRAYGNDAVALALGTSGQWDDTTIAVCGAAWYEAGKTRPWRMLYRGATSTGGTKIGLATSTDGITWARQDTQGSALSAAVLSGGTGGAWDNDSIDPACVIKVGSTYYLFYSTITIGTRQLGLATSTDDATGGYLTSWTKDAANPIMQGVANTGASTQGPDQTYAGSAAAAQGFFCPDVVHWPRANGTDRYVMFCPHYESGSTTSSLDVFTSDVPQFYITHRTFLGSIVRTSGGGTNGSAIANPPTIDGIALSGSALDTPHIVTDDIGRNVATSTGLGGDVGLKLSVYSAAGKWSEIFLIHHKTLAGASLSNICADLPVSAPVHAPAPAGPDAATIALWLPGATGTLRDMTGGQMHLSGNQTQIGANGAQLVLANSQFLQFGAGASGNATPFAALNAVGATGSLPYTLECRFTPGAAIGSMSNNGFMALIAYTSNSGAPYHFYLLLQCTGTSPYTYRLVLYVTSGAATKTFNSPNLTGLTIGTPTRFTVTNDGTKAYAFQDGTLLNAGGSAFAWAVDNTTNPQLYIGVGYTGAIYFADGWLDEIRISNSCRWTATYTPAALANGYATSGTIFTRVYDYAAAGYPASMTPTATITGTGTATYLAKPATSTTEDTTAGDFASLTGPSAALPITRYQQYAITLTSDGTAANIATLSALTAGGMDSAYLLNTAVVGLTAGTATIPAANTVYHTAAAYGVGGAATTPTAQTGTEGAAAQLVTDQAAVTAAAGSIYTGATILGVNGSATTAAAQLATDQAAVTAAAGSIYTGTTILGVNGSATTAAAQLATDQAAVALAAAYIVSGQTILGTTGTAAITGHGGANILGG